MGKKEKQKVDDSSSTDGMKASHASTPPLKKSDGYKFENGASFLKKHEFVQRVSMLDDYEPTSALRQSSLYGFYNCIYVIMVFYFFVAPLLKYKEKGVFFETKLLDMMQNDLPQVLITWPLFYLWSHIAFILQYLVIWRVPKFIIQIIQHFSQGCMFLYCHYLVATRNWPLGHGAFVTLQSCVFFMKMHSYTMTNDELRKIWEAKGKPKSTNLIEYPNNINFKNFQHFMWAPVLVYETSYPRTDRIRKGYLLRKGAYTIAILYLDYLIVSEYVFPLLMNPRQYSVLQMTYSLMLPMTSFCMLTFFLIFECMLNFFAEVSRFADRLFYQDWWNSYNYEEYNRKWNRPVHEFLYRHIYLHSIWNWGYSIKKAQVLTFVFSALLHEYALTVSLQKISPILTLFMLFQIPLMLYTRKLKGTAFGNQFFWFGLIQGIPLIMCLYSKANELMENGLKSQIL